MNKEVITIDSIWGKLIKKNKTIKQHVINCADITIDKKHKVDKAIEEICSEFDIEKPMWLSDNEKNFFKFNKTKFQAMHFIDEIDFDSFEIELIIEKKKNNSN